MFWRVSYPANFAKSSKDLSRETLFLLNSQAACLQIPVWFFSHKISDIFQIAIF